MRKENLRKIAGKFEENCGKIRGERRENLRRIARKLRNTFKKHIIKNRNIDLREIVSWQHWEFITKYGDFLGNGKMVGNFLIPTSQYSLLNFILGSLKKM